MQHKVTLKLAGLKVCLLLQMINLLPCLLYCVHLRQLQQQGLRACAVSRVLLQLLCSNMTTLLRLVQVKVFTGLCMRYAGTFDNLQTSALQLLFCFAQRMAYQLANSAYESRWLNIRAKQSLYNQVHLGRGFSLIALPSRLAGLQNKLLP